jgi:hypothetical protein
VFCFGPVSAGLPLLSFSPGSTVSRWPDAELGLDVPVPMARSDAGIIKTDDWPDLLIRC